MHFRCTRLFLVFSVPDRSAKAIAKAVFRGALRAFDDVAVHAERHGRTRVAEDARKAAHVDAVRDQDARRGVPPFERRERSRLFFAKIRP